MAVGPTRSMPEITASVGEGGKNLRPDVKLVQQLLNNFVKALGLIALDTDGLCGRATVTAIRKFQQQVMKMTNADARIDPGGRTLRALLARAEELDRAARLSGARWWHANQGLYLNSASSYDLAPDFRAKVEAFIAALRAGGAQVTITSTRRNKIRAYLMHYCYRLASGMIDAPAIPPEPGCAILWDHGSAARSRMAAQEMVDLFDIVYEPSLTSRHIEGKAVDMTIRWYGTIRVRDAGGNARTLSYPVGGTNTVLHEIGRSYGVNKLVGDEPHWSTDGK